MLLNVHLPGNESDFEQLSMKSSTRYFLAGAALGVAAFGGVVLHPWLLHYRMAQAVAACDAGNKEKLTEKLVRSGISADTFSFLLFGQTDCKLIYQRYRHSGIQSLPRAGHGVNTTLDNACRLIPLFATIRP